MSVRVLIADDQQLIRDGFRMILATATDIEIVGEASNGAEAVALARELRPDVVLMDIRMPELDGIEATRRILAQNHDPKTSVLILTTFDLDEYVYDALRAGASGFLLKDVPARQLVAAIRTVGEGDALLSPSITRRLIEEFSASRAPAAPAPELDELTPRELEVFRLLATGKTNGEIAAELIIGETTVKTHVTRILMKLGVRDRVQAVVLAYETRLVSPGLPTKNRTQRLMPNPEARGAVPAEQQPPTSREGEDRNDGAAREAEPLGSRFHDTARISRSSRSVSPCAASATAGSWLFALGDPKERRDGRT